MRGRPLPNRSIFIRPNGGCFKIGLSALKTMLCFVQDESHKPEAGGVLLGRHIIDTNDIVVDWVTTPLPGDRQSRFRFFRTRRRHQELIDQAWRESSRTCTYLGEWHTHPEAAPAPSIVDQFNWRRKLMVDQFSDCLFFIIVGADEMRVWEGRYRRINLYQLKLID